MKNVYVGTSLKNAKRAKEIQKRFLNAGYNITYDWTSHGQVYTEEELGQYALKEEQGVVDADIIFIIFPARNGSHFEMGMARGLQLMGAKNKIVLLIEEKQESKTFHYLPDIVRFTDEDEAINYTFRYLNGLET